MKRYKCVFFHLMAIAILFVGFSPAGLAGESITIDINDIILPNGSIDFDYIREMDFQGDIIIEGEIAIGDNESALKVRGAEDDQDNEHWSDKFFLSGVSPGFAYVYDAIIYNGDLIIGGSFHWVDGVEVRRIARWDGYSWHSMGGGLNGYVADMIIYDGKLIVTGPFTEAGGIEANRIAAWDGVSWTPLGNGFDKMGYSLLEFNGDLIASGIFDTAGTVYAKYMAKWDGSNWEAIYEASDNLWIGSGLIVHDGYLYAKKIRGAVNSYLVKWDGVIWEELESAPNGRINDMVFYDSMLVGGGFFSEAGGVPCKNIAGWDGALWHPLGDGLEAVATGTSTEIWDLMIYEGNLIAGGNFDMSGSTPCNYIAEWNGTTWQPLAEGMGGGIDDGSLWVFALEEYGGNLIAAGGFTTAGNSFANRVASWNGESWSDISSKCGAGINGTVYTVTSFGGDIIAGGDFNLAGKDSCSNIARWDGTKWYPLADGVFGSVYTATVYNGQLYVGGIIRDESQMEIYNQGVYQWDGISWLAVSDEIVVYDENRYPIIYGILAYNDNLIVGGAFNEIDGVPALNIASWDGDSWSAMGAGIPYFKTMIVYDSQLVAAGWDNVYIWDGLSWNLLGTEGQPLCFVDDFADYNGKLIGLGDFSEATGLPICHIAEWDGNGWIPFGPQEFSAQGMVILNDLAMLGSDLVLVGRFNEIDGNPINNISAWDGSAWQPMGSGTLGVGKGLFPDQNYKLYVFGDLLSAGEKQSCNIALWTNKMCGDVNADNNFNILDITSLIRYLFWNGPPPIPLESGDMDYDGNISLVDISIMIEYLYIHGFAQNCN